MGILYVIATPIGNLEDISFRATKTLASVDIILCEDTRRTGQMLSTLSIPHKKLQSYYDEVEDQRIPEIIDALTSDQNVALVSDAGTPLISDPGFRLVRECKKRDITVVSVPGASAVLAALTSSGLPTDKFTFLGYPPEKKTARLEVFNNLLPKHTTIFYCAPHKLLTTLEDMKEVLGDIEICICRELTKIHEECWNGSVTDALDHFKDPKGEFVLLLRV